MRPSPSDRVRAGRGIDENLAGGRETGFLATLMRGQPALASCLARFLPTPLMRAAFLVGDLPAFTGNLTLLARIHRRKSAIFLTHIYLHSWPTRRARLQARRSVLQRLCPVKFRSGQLEVADLWPFARGSEGRRFRGLEDRNEIRKTLGSKIQNIRFSARPDARLAQVAQGCVRDREVSALQTNPD